MKATSSLLTEWEAKLIQIKGKIDEERSEMSKLLSHPLNSRASMAELVARQNEIHAHTEKLHTLENQYHSLESKIEIAKEKS